MNNRKRGVLRWLLLGALGSLALTQALAQAQTSEPPLTWQTCSACPEPPEIAFSGAPLWRGTAVTNTLHLGRPQVPERASQNTSIHGASLPLPPAWGYRVAFTFTLATWDSYNAPGTPNPPYNGGTGYWDSFSVSLSNAPYWALPLSDPLGDNDPLRLGFLWGGTSYGDGFLETRMGSERVFLEARPWAPNFLNVVLDTATLPAANHNYPSWGTVRLQWIDPLTTLSRYVARKDQLSLETFRAWGCARGESLPPWGWGTVILDFGYPRMQNGEYGAATLVDFTFVSTTTIVTLTRSFLDGFAECNGTARLYLALGVNNASEAVTRAHGRAWAQMINRLNQDVWDNPHWLGRFWVLGAIDAEPGWNSSQATREWVEGYTEVADLLDLGSYLLNFGSCDGCPFRGCPSCQPSNGWTLEDLWYISWGAEAAEPFPEIYLTNGVNAEQWFHVARYGLETHQRVMIFTGVLTTWTACQETRDEQCQTTERRAGIDNQPMEGYLQMHRILSSHPILSQAYPRFSSDISWER
jgi:hypothetical protein